MQHSLEEFILATQFPPMVALERKNFWHISNAGKLVLLAVAAIALAIGAAVLLVLVLGAAEKVERYAHE